jgi:ferredoxin-NADP reductase
MNFFTAELISHRDLTSNIFEVEFKALDSKNFTFEVGNYTSLKVNDNRKPLVFRAYTFASTPNNKKTFKLLIKLFCDESGVVGRGSGFLYSLKIGDKVEFIGPAGKNKFAVDLNSTKQLLLLGTGTGIAPFFAIAQKMSFEKSKRQIKLFFGVSYPQDIFYRSEFAELKKINPNFDFQIAVSRPPENYSDLTGRLPEILENEFSTGIPNNVEAKVCGSEISAAGIKAKLLKLGLPEEQIEAEGFGV